MLDNLLNYASYYGNGYVFLWSYSARVVTLSHQSINILVKNCIVIIILQKMDIFSIFTKNTLTLFSVPSQEVLTLEELPDIKKLS